MQNSIPTDRLLSIGKSSEYLGVSIDTLRRWEKRGRITPLRSPGGHRYYSKDELDSLFGKRYTRDEDTQRRTDEELGKTTDTTENVNPPAPPETVIQEVSPLNETQEAQDFSNLLHPLEEEPPNPPVVDPVTQIPPWRPVEVTTQEVSSIPDEQPPQPSGEINISRVPENTPIPETSPPEPSYQSILTPEKNDDSLTEEEIERRLHSIIKNGKSSSKSGVALIIFSSLFIIADIILLIIWVSSSRIISPIP